MGKGELALVLHAHLPYVRSAESGSLEEDWFFQALLECYIPLLQILEKSAESKNQEPKITIGLSPTLLSLFNDKDLKQRFPSWLLVRLELLQTVKTDAQEAASQITKTIQNHLIDWNSCNGDLIQRFAALQKSGVVDLLTCAATHGYLPLLRENPEAIRGQLNTAVKEHQRLFGMKPLGIWLPECAYYEGLDQFMIEAGLRYAVLDGHGLLHANPRPRYGLYAPICSSNGVAFFGRDSDATLPVWSAKDGYPGSPSYREFHRDLGWDLSKEELKKFGIKDQRPLGLKLHKVTSQNTPLNKKQIYQPDTASELVKEHAREYLKARRKQLDSLLLTMGNNPLLVAPFDAELFGHWWFEGPIFIAELFNQAKEEDIIFTRLRDILKSIPSLQLCNPCPSSWGQGGYHNYWTNESNSWVILEWSKAGKAMVENSNNFITPDPIKLRILQQAARELLLAQSSDWSFILRAGTTTQLAKERIHLHVDRFWKLLELLQLDKEKNLVIKQLERLEQEDSIFPLIEIKDWSKV